MVISLLSFSPPSGASKVASPLFASKAFLDLARLTVPLSFLSWSPLSFSFLRCSPLNLIFLWLLPLKPLVTSCAMLLKNPELPTPGSLLMVSLNSLQLMFFQLTARSSSKLTLPSCALSLPTAQFFGISAVTIPNFVPFLRRVGLLSTTNLNRGVTPASLFSLRVLPAHASKFSLVTANKPVQGRVATFCVNLYSSVSPIKELVSLMALLPSFLLTKGRTAQGTLFLARSCLGQVPDGAPFSQRSELATGRTAQGTTKATTAHQQGTTKARTAHSQGETRGEQRKGENSTPTWNHIKGENSTPTKDDKRENSTPQGT